ncbi:MAG: hypothetical protein WDN48_15400 [Pseudolabrys sp.]
MIAVAVQVADFQHEKDMPSVLQGQPGQAVSTALECNIDELVGRDRVGAVACGGGDLLDRGAVLRHDIVDFDVLSRRDDFHRWARRGRRRPNSGTAANR